MNANAQLEISFPNKKNIFERGIHFGYKVCIKPLSENEDTGRQEIILNTILCGLIPLLIILDAFVLRAEIANGVTYRGFSFLSFTIIISIFVYLLILSRSGYHKIASFILLFLYFLATTYGAIHWGAELPLVSISYIVIIIMSSILLSTRSALYITVFLSLTIISITYFQVNNIFHPLLDWKQNAVRQRDSVELSIFFFLVTIVSWLSNKEMEKSLVRARASEKALQEERDSLEIKVEERTKELRDMQKDKVSQLYRFAEFGKLSSGVFHDLMNSLNAVVANVDRLEHNRDHLPEAQAYIAKAVLNGRRITNYVAAVRKQIADTDSLSYFSVEKEIQDALDILQFKMRQAQVTCTLSITKDVILYGNALKFYQIILNLVGNAIDACEEKEDGHIEIMVTNTDTHVSLAIKDSGCGIDRDVLESIFNPFFTTKPYGKGIGLGLSNTKEIIEKNFHGIVAVESEFGIGTTFIITIPIQHADTTPTS